MAKNEEAVVKEGHLYTNGKTVVHAFHVWDANLLEDPCVRYTKLPGTDVIDCSPKTFLRRYPTKIDKILITEE